MVQITKTSQGYEVNIDGNIVIAKDVDEMVKVLNSSIEACVKLKTGYFSGSSNK